MGMKQNKFLINRMKTPKLKIENKVQEQWEVKQDKFLTNRLKTPKLKIASEVRMSSPPMAINQSDPQ